MSPYSTGIHAHRIIKVMPICEVGWFVPGTRADDGMPTRGKTRLAAATPLAAWDQFESDMRDARMDHTYVVLYADLALRAPRGKLTETLRREIELSTAHNFWLAQ